MNVKAVKWMSLLGSIALGVSLMSQGQVETGAGVITAALSSSSGLFGTKQ